MRASFFSRASGNEHSASHQASILVALVGTFCAMIFLFGVDSSIGTQIQCFSAVGSPRPIVCFSRVSFRLGTSTSDLDTSADLDTAYGATVLWPTPLSQLGELHRVAAASPESVLSRIHRGPRLNFFFSLICQLHYSETLHLVTTVAWLIRTYRPRGLLSV